MRWVIPWAFGAVLATAPAAHPAEHEAEVYLSGPAFTVAGLKFTVPSKWLAETPDNTSRAGQWHVPPPHGQEGEGSEVTVTWFGPGIGGGAKDNIQAWAGLMADAQGHAPVPDIKTRTVGGVKISEVALLGTYNQPSKNPGFPPQAKPGYELLGAVVEGPQGNIYWRWTGPEPLVTAGIPLFDKIIDSLKPAEKAP